MQLYDTNRNISSQYKCNMFLDALNICFKPAKQNVKFHILNFTIFFLSTVASATVLNI